MVSERTAQPPPIEEAPGRINPALYIDRELSWIEFNRRVLEEARDPRHHLLERVKFAAIFNSNLDEFFMIRVSGVKEQIAAGVSHYTPNGLTPMDQLRAIRRALLPFVDACQRLVLDDLLPALRRAGIWVMDYAELSPEQQAALEHYYVREVFPVLTPLAIDPSHRFPFISNLSLNLAVVIDDPGHPPRFARVKVPEVLPRLVRVSMLPDGDATSATPVGFVWLEQVIAAHVHSLFPGKHVRAVHAFHITRDVDLEIREDEAADLLLTVEETVRQRRFGSVVRLAIEAGTGPVVRELLVRNLDITEDDVYPVEGPLGLSALMALYDLDRPDLKDPPFVPAVPEVLRGEADIFAAIREEDILLHHPFESFSPVVELVKAAARDPDVLAIKQTLYRVGRNSPVVQALMQAREEEKQVAALVELKARFDEENNIGWARALERGGVHVVYGLLGLKIHAKILLIVRREPDGIRRYVHLGTGNYNAQTARVYTDLGLLTCDEAIGADVTELFNVLTGFSGQTTYRKLLVAPGELQKALLRKIDREIARHEQAGDGRLIFKCNGLTDEEVILALYRAAQAGVQVDLIVRGICSIRPAIPGLSETLRVRSVVGRFLEHDRQFYFHNGGDEELYLGSADLMDRNLHRRIETLFPIRDQRLLRYLRDTVLEGYLKDNARARELRPDGSYVRCTPGEAPPYDAQLRLLAAAAT